MSDAAPIACRQVTGLRRGATRFGAISDRSVSTSRFEAKAEIAMKRPTLYKLGRINGTREIVVRPNYVMGSGNRRRRRSAARSACGPEVAEVSVQLPDVKTSFRLDLRGSRCR